MGRPSKYKKEYNEQAYKLCLLGATDKELADFFEVGTKDIEEWISCIEEFRNAIGKAIIDYPAHVRKKEEKRAKRREYKKQPHIKKQANEYMKNKIKNDIQYRIRHNVSSTVRKKVTSKTKTGMFSNLGYTVQELIKHLESKFQEGMNWGNYGKVWHIDHIKPDSWFNYKSMEDEEFKKCWAIENLQPLFAEDNLRKGNRYAG